MAIGRIRAEPVDKRLFQQRFRTRLYAYPWKSALNDKPLSERKLVTDTGGYAVVMGRKLFRNDTVLTSFRAVTAVSQTMDDASTISNSKHGLFPRSTLRPPQNNFRFPISNPVQENCWGRRTTSAKRAPRSRSPSHPANGRNVDYVTV